MARPKSDLLSQFGVMFEIVKAIVNAVLNAGGSDENLRELLTPPGKDKLNRIAAILVEKSVKAEPSLPPKPTIIEIDLELDDDLDFDAGKALGTYDEANPNATAERFPIEKTGRGKRKVKAKLVCFHRELGDEESDSEVDHEIGKLNIGKRGGTQAVLAVGAQHKELQRTKNIVGSAFWSHPDGSRYFLCLRCGRVLRWLDLRWLDQEDQWFVDIWFVVVPQE